LIRWSRYASSEHPRTIQPCLTGNQKSDGGWQGYNFRDGDLARVKELARRCPALLTCQYDYTAPLRLAVGEGHLDFVRYLAEQGALDPGYKNHPFLEPLVRNLVKSWQAV
jgi:hypothetical protein